MSQTVTRRRATKERHDALVTLVRAGVTSVETLAERLGVSASTVRRDLARLQRAGRVARTYGGAMAREPFHERSFGESTRLNQEAKARIAVTAAALVPERATVFLDAGTTCLALARLLVDRGPLRVVTRGLEAALLLAQSPDVCVVVLGGHVRPLSHGLVGPLSSVALDRLTFDVAFLGADVVDPERGLGEPTSEETDVKERAAGRSGAVYVLADASKLGREDVPAWVPFGTSWAVVTDPQVPSVTVEAFTSYGVRIVTAPADGGRR